MVSLVISFSVSSMLYVLVLLIIISILLFIVIVRVITYFLEALAKTPKYLIKFQS